MMVKQAWQRLNSGYSVRARIIAISIIPLAGFLIDGIAFTGGEREVDHAFRSVSDAAVIDDAARELKDSASTMRVGARDFASRPSKESMGAFENAQQRAVRFLDTIADCRRREPGVERSANQRRINEPVSGCQQRRPRSSVPGRRRGCLNG